MPSGAKKRKAAKKKKENLSINPVYASTHSHDDVNHQVDKDSDAGEVSSPASQDFHSHHSKITEGDKEETNNKENMVQIDRKVKVEDDSIEKDGKTERDEPPRKSYDGSSSRSSSSSSSSSSDDESHGISSSSVAVDIDPVVDSVLSETLAEPISTAIIEEANVVVQTPVVDEITSLVEKVEVNENVEKSGSSIGEKVGISADFVDAASETQESIVIQSVENTARIPDLKEIVTQENDERLIPSYGAQNVPVNNGVQSEKDSITQPLLEPTVQRTAWKSCCGLCDLFTGSAR